MKFNSITCIISIAVLCITALYVLVYAGLTGLLLTSAISLLIASFVEQFELVVAITVIISLFYTLYLKSALTQEGFKDASEDEKDTDKVTNVKKDNEEFEPSGVSNSKVDVSSNSHGDVPTTESKPAPTKNTVDQVKSNFKDIEASEFKSATNTLFKLGQMPSEHADGPRLDAGKTIMKAMSSFDPSTISAMTTDTKKLLETQKGLMSMLNQMRPVLADGKELLQTFSGMFGGIGSGNGPFELGKI